MADKTNKYPEGELNKDDEGEMLMEVYIEKGKIVIDFQIPIVWFAMSPNDAADFGAKLIQRAKEAGLTKPFTMQL